MCRDRPAEQAARNYRRSGRNLHTQYAGQAGLCPFQAGTPRNASATLDVSPNPLLPFACVRRFTNASNTVKRNTSGLRPWTVGQSGNPNGRPRTERGNLDRELKRVLAGRDKRDGRPRAAVVAETLYELGRKGNVTALTYMFDRVLGRPAQAVELSGGDRPIHILAGVAARAYLDVAGDEDVKALPDSAGPEPFYIEGTPRDAPLPLGDSSHASRDGSEPMNPPSYHGDNAGAG